MDNPEFTIEDFHITPIRMNQYISWLKKTKLSSTTINIYITLLKVIINYAIKMRYVTYDIDPFITARIPSAQKSLRNRKTAFLDDSVEYLFPCTNVWSRTTLR